MKIVGESNMKCEIAMDVGAPQDRRRLRERENRYIEILIGGELQISGIRADSISEISSTLIGTRHMGNSSLQKFRNLSST